jgi:FkbM family methyltransferase
MNVATPLKLLRLGINVRNPMAIVLDRLGRQQAPYLLRLWNGLSLELRPGRGDLDAFRDCWLSRSYLSDGAEILPGNTVVDVGANIGCFTLFAARSVGPSGRVISVEPGAETFQRLQRHVTMNHLNNVMPMQAAVAAEPGPIELHNCPNGLFSSMFSEIDGRSNAGTVQRVDGFTLEQVLAKNSVDRCHFLKLDCEGAEHGIVRTISKETAAKIDQIGMELHQVQGTDENVLIRKLEQFGFTMTRSEALLHFRRR